MIGRKNAYLIYVNQPEPYRWCPCCSVSPFRSFMRGMVYRGFWDEPRKWLRCWWYKAKFKHWAIICTDCKEIVGWE